MFRESKPIDPPRIARYVPNESVIVGLRKSVRQIVKSDGRYLLQLIIIEQRVLDHPVCFAIWICLGQIKIVLRVIQNLRGVQHIQKTWI